MKSLKTNSAFTIVELLIVIVIIGILAAITIVSFGGITGQANQASLQSDLNSNSRKLQLYFTQYGSYPTTLDGNNCPSAPTADTNYCLKASTGTTLTYQGTSIDYSLYGVKGSTIYKTSSTAAPFQTKLASVCPTGFIVVPGSTTYGTSDFCVMKYEAKCASTSTPTVGLTSPTSGYSTLYLSLTGGTCGSGNAAVSIASGFPIARVSQSAASTIASSAFGCTGCKLMTEAEWMTIAQNVLSNPVNWSGNAVGSGSIYSGHNDNSPANALIASDDSDGYYGTGSTSGNQKRTLVLSNGEIIWDFAGNVAEVTSASMSSAQPTPSGFAWREWTAVSGGTFTVNPYPSNTGISGASSWTSTNGIGQINSSSGDLSARAYVRGGTGSNGVASGVLSLNLSFSTSLDDSTVGMRVSR